MIDRQQILVWDWPVRVGHWLLVMLFALAWLTGDSEELRLVHAALGGALVGILLFRVLWGLIGSYHARFSSFVRGRQAVWGYVTSLLGRHSGSQEPEYAGHNAAAGWAILALLTLGLLTGVTGWVAYQGEAWEGLGEVHELLASAMLGVALFHVAGVLVSSLTHGENLTWSMFSGYKLGRPGEAIANAQPLAVPLLLAWVAACAWWFTL
jgi:cytochrome b